MTAKRDSKSKPKKDERPKLKKEKLRDLETEKQGEGVKGGAAHKCPGLGTQTCSYYCDG